MGRRPCCSKDEDLNRGAWTTEEDRILIDYVTAHGEGRWRNISKRAGLKRCSKSCRLRWLNYLRPDIKRGNISPDEEELIVRLHKLLGNRWSLIAGRLPGRTDNEIKNYWNTILRKRQHNNKNLKVDSAKELVGNTDKMEGGASREHQQNEDKSARNSHNIVQPSLCEAKPQMSLAAFWAAALRYSEVASNRAPIRHDELANNCFDGDILADDIERNLSAAQDPLMNFEFGDLCLSDLLNYDLTGSDYSSSPPSEYPQPMFSSEEPMLQDRNLLTDSQRADNVRSSNHIM